MYNGELQILIRNVSVFTTCTCILNENIDCMVWICKRVFLDLSTLVESFYCSKLYSGTFQQIFHEL